MISSSRGSRALGRSTKQDPWSGTILEAQIILSIEYHRIGDNSITYNVPASFARQLLLLNPATENPGFARTLGNRIEKEVSILTPEPSLDWWYAH
jgi:hypothetical protein